MEVLSKQLAWAIVRSRQDPVVIADSTGGFLAASQSMLAMHEAADVEALHDFLADPSCPLRISHVDGAPIPWEDSPYGRILAGAALPATEVRIVRDDTGAEWWIRCSVSIIPAQDGEPMGAILHFYDRTRARAASENVRRTAAALAASEARYRSLAAATSAVVWQADASGNLVSPNDSWEKFTGMPIVDPGSDRAMLFQAIHEADRELSRGVWLKAIGSGAPMDFECRLRHAPSGRFRYVAVRGVPVRGKAGELVEWIGTVADIDEWKRAQLSDRVLTRTIDRTRGLSDPADVLAVATADIVEYLEADGVDLLDVDVASGLISFSPDLRQSRSETQWSIELMPSGIRRDLAAGLTVVLKDRTCDPRIPQEFQTAPNFLAYRSYIAVPRMVDGVWAGHLAIYSAKPREWQAHEIALSENVAARLWQTIDKARHVREMASEIEERRNAQRQLAEALAREKRMVRVLQQSLMQIPDEHAFPGLPIETLYHSAGPDLEIGGDFLDAFAVDKSRVALVVGDVSGKGLEAASRTAQIKFLLRGYLRHDLSAPTSFRRLSDYVCKSQELDAAQPMAFICVMVAIVNRRTGAVVVTTAGGEPPVVLRASGASDRFQATGLPLGIDASFHYVSDEKQMAPGDRILMFTDGLTEARKQGTLFGTHGIVAAAREVAPDAPLIDLAERIVDCARRFSGGTLGDDACLLVARRE